MPPTLPHCICIDMFRRLACLCFVITLLLVSLAAWGVSPTPARLKNGSPHHQLCISAERKLQSA